jgi:hypothetical protein
MTDPFEKNDPPMLKRASLFETYMKLARQVWSSIHNHELSIDEGLAMLKPILTEHMEQKQCTVE